MPLKLRNRMYQAKYRANHPERIKQSWKRYSESHRDELVQKAREYRAANKEKVNASVRKYRQNHLEAVRASGRARYHRKRAEYRAGRKALRARFFEIYGARCHCSCGCQQTILGFLTIGHINNDGAEDRRANGKSEPLLRKATRHPDFSKYTALCWNCNSGAHMNGGICPASEVRDVTKATESYL